MLGFMNEEAFNKTMEENVVTFIQGLNKDCGLKGIIGAYATSRYDTYRL